MEKKYYGWILLGVFMVIAGILLAMSNNFFRDEKPEILAPASNLGSNLSEKNALPESETAIEINMEDSNADFEADRDDFESDPESLNDFDEDIELESLDDERLL